MKVSDIIKMIVENGETSGEPNGNGNTVHRWSCCNPNLNRYTVQGAEDFHSNGWEQISTHQDASYFGVWYSHKCLGVLTYAEGDWSYVSSMTLSDHYAEVIDHRRFYEEMA